MFSILREIIPVASPCDIPTIRLQGFFHKQQIQLGQIEHMHVIPVSLSLVNLEPLPTGQGPAGELWNLPGHAFARAGAEAVDTAGADDGGADTLGPAVEDDLVDVAVPRVVGEVCDFVDVVKVVVHLGGQLLAEAVGFPVEEDGGAGGVDEVAWGGAGAEAPNDCIRAFHMVVVSGV